MLAACGTVVGPNYRVPEAAVVKRPEAAAPFLGASEKPFSQQALPAQWWRLYRDSTLDALIDQAFTANTDLRVAAANLARAQAVVAEAEQLGRPAVDLAAAPGFGRAAGAASGVNHSLQDRASYDAGLHVSYQLDLFGKIARAVEAAHADSDSAQAASDLARVTVAAETTRAYAEACSAGRQIAIARQSVALQDKFVRSTAQRVKLGRGTALDNSRALGQRDQLRAAVPPLEAQRRAALYRLAVLTGETPSHFPQSVAACEHVPRLVDAIPVGDGAALLRRRPDIRQAERTLAASTARIGVATAELYPQISLGLSAGSTGSLSGFGEGNTLRYSLGPLISWSLPSTSSGPRAHRASRSRDGRIVGALRRRRAERVARNGNGADQLCPRARPNAALKAARDQSALASNQAGRLYRFGRTDFLTTLDAERTLASTEAAVPRRTRRWQRTRSLFLAWMGRMRSRSLAALALGTRGHKCPPRLHSKKAAFYTRCMRKLLLLTPLLLAGCVDDSATYYIDGNQHALTVRAMQEYFWKKDVTLDLLASRMPDCQRRIPLGALPMSDVEIELFQSGENVYTLRAGEQAWRVETEGCSELEAPEQVTGQPLGLFHLDENKKLVFEKAEPETPPKITTAEPAARDRGGEHASVDALHPPHQRGGERRAGIGVDEQRRQRGHHQGRDHVQRPMHPEEDPRPGHRQAQGQQRHAEAARLAQLADRQRQGHREHAGCVVARKGAVGRVVQVALSEPDHEGTRMEPHQADELAYRQRHERRQQGAHRRLALARRTVYPHQHQADRHDQDDPFGGKDRQLQAPARQARRGIEQGEQKLVELVEHGAPGREKTWSQPNAAIRQAWPISKTSLSEISLPERCG